MSSLSPFFSQKKNETTKKKKKKKKQMMMTMTPTTIATATKHAHTQRKSNDLFMAILSTFLTDKQ